MTSDVDRPSDDAEWNFAARHETPIARLDRHWTDLLQELRVAPVVLHRMRFRQHAPAYSITSMQ